MANPKKKLDRIDLDELFDSPVNRGMLSFLQRPPEEARERLREKERVNRLDSRRLDHPEGELLPGTPTPSVLPPTNTADVVLDYLVGETPIDASHPLGAIPSHSIEDDSDQSKKEGLQLHECIEYPVGVLPTGVIYTVSDTSSVFTPGDINETSHPTPGRAIHPVGVSPVPVTVPVADAPGTPSPTENAALNNPPPELAIHPVGVSPSDGVLAFPGDPAKKSAHTASLKSTAAVTHPLGESTSASISPPFATAPSTRTTLSVDQQIPVTQVFDGGIVGRQQKIRRATVAQDGHSSGEQLLYQSLWNAARLETQETRILSVGYKGMSMLCKLDHTNCKKNIQNLIEKLAAEVIDSYIRATSTGTTYRLFSYKEILRRRESAGLVWVIRANGVKFVNLAGAMGNSPTGPVGISRGGSMGNLPSGRDGKPPSASIGKSHAPPLGEAPTQLGREENLFRNSTSTALRELLQAQLPTFDDTAVNQLWATCRKNVPDVSIEEVSELFHSKHRIAFAPGVKNPIGLLITAVANACTPVAIAEMRKGREAAAKPEITRTREEQIADLEFYIREFPPNHEQVADWKTRLKRLKEEI